MEMGSKLTSRQLGKFRPCLASAPLKTSHRKKEDQELSQGDLRTEFYKQYDKEAKDCDDEFREKYKDDLDVTLIFVRCEHHLGARAYWCRRLVYSLPSLPPSLSQSTPNSSPIQTKRPPISSASSSTKCTTTPTAKALPPSNSHGLVPHVGSSRSRQSCSPASPLHYSLPSWQCLASNG